MSAEIEDLQSRVAFQEDTLTELSEVIARQDRQIEALSQALAGLAKKFDDLLYEREQSGESALDERPPHY